MNVCSAALSLQLLSNSPGFPSDSSGMIESDSNDDIMRLLERDALALQSGSSTSYLSTLNTTAKIHPIGANAPAVVYGLPSFDSSSSLKNQQVRLQLF